MHVFRLSISLFAQASDVLINYVSSYNPRPKCLLRRLNYSFERFDVLENCRDTRDGLCFIIQELNIVAAATSTVSAHLALQIKVLSDLIFLHMKLVGRNLKDGNLLFLFYRIQKVIRLCMMLFPRSATTC